MAERDQQVHIAVGVGNPERLRAEHDHLERIVLLKDPPGQLGDDFVDVARAVVAIVQLRRASACT